MCGDGPWYTAVQSGLSALRADGSPLLRQPAGNTLAAAAGGVVGVVVAGLVQAGPVCHP